MIHGGHAGRRLYFTLARFSGGGSLPLGGPARRSRRNCGTALGLYVPGGRCLTDAFSGLRRR